MNFKNILNNILNYFKPKEFIYVNSDELERQKMNRDFPIQTQKLVNNRKHIIVDSKETWDAYLELQKTKQKKWDDRFLDLAKNISEWSLDPSTKVGAVIVDSDRRVVSVGYNGLPQGVEDTEERLNNREVKYATTVHGEMNAILFAKTSVAGCTLYTQPFMPCSRCASMVIQAGIIRVVAPLNDNPRWAESFKLTQELFKEAGVELVLYKGDEDVKS